MIRILLVEDDKLLGEILKENLELENYSVDWRQTGAALPEYVKKNIFDLVILDVMLPGENGLDVCRKIKASPETKNIPVIILSAKGEEIDVVLGLELGADDYVSKPFSPKILFSRIKAILRRGKEPEKGVKTIRFSDFTLAVYILTLRTLLQTLLSRPRNTSSLPPMFSLR